MHHDSLGSLILVVLVCVLFAGIGVAALVNPDYFIRHSGMRKGGELLGDWNRLGMQVVGLVVIIIVIWALYSTLRG